MPFRSYKSSPCQGTAVLSSDPPPGQFPKLFQSSQMAAISLHRQRPCPQQKYFLLLWNQTDDPLTTFFIQDCHLPIQCWSTRACICDVSIYQSKILEEQCWQPTAGSWKFQPASCDLSSSCWGNAGGTQCTMIAPGIVLEHGHHTHLCTLMGKEKIG